MSKYDHIFFDLDHTLWDYVGNANETLGDLYDRFDIGGLTGKDEDAFSAQFHSVNREMWDLHDKGKINKAAIRKERFRWLFDQLGASHVGEELTREISNEFIKICPTKGKVLPYSIELLDYLLGNYRLHIITNGFSDVQHVKLRSSGMEDYFDQVIISETVGYKKPDKRIFEYALSTTGALPERSMMVGDNLETDIMGARNASLDQAYYNPEKEPHDRSITYEISSLGELKSIL